jgi:uncharacterized damage-inducible protein DinB
MKMTEFFLALLDREAAASRRVLERVPEGNDDWKPHEKSMPLGYLATLVATMPGWIEMIINQDELDFAPPDGAQQRRPSLRTQQEWLAGLDSSLSKARAALENTTDEHLLTTWRLLAGGRKVSQDPRHIVISDAVFCHMAHHRGQLTVYQRLLNAPVAAIYGPSADEGLKF